MPSVAASRHSTATAMASPSSTSPVGASRPRSIGMTAPSAVRCVSAGCPTRPPTSPRSTAPTRSTSTATARWTWRSCGSAGTCSCAVSEIAASNEPTRPGPSMAGTSGPLPSARNGRARPGCPPSPWATISPSTPRASRPERAPTTSSSDPTRRAPATLRPWHSRPAIAPCRCSSVIGTEAAGGTCESATTVTTTSMARSSCGASRPARRPADTPMPTVGSRCRSGAWASPARMSPVTATPTCSSPARATTSSRR